MGVTRRAESCLSRICHAPPAREAPQAGRDGWPLSRTHPGLYGLQPGRGAPRLHGGQQDYHYPTFRVMAARGRSHSGSARYRSSPEWEVSALPPGARRRVGPCGAVYSVFKEQEGLCFSLYSLSGVKFVNLSGFIF